MKHFLILFFSFCFLGSFAQKDTAVEVDAKGIKKIYILAEEVFRINLKTSETNKITLTSHSEGEYYNDISLDMKVEQEQITLTSNFPAQLQNGYDKLSAHKVFSLEIMLEIPEGLEVYVRSSQASLRGRGNFNYLEAELKSGYCQLTNFTGNALINTYSGNIEMETSNAVFTALSRNGKVLQSGFSRGDHKIELRSITGDISVWEN
ncbi:hypothetical protein FK178_12885 [Antarcticibacterium arcticum]|uniref:Adhesin domain-containing protein n=1 Tax=Antarcticibacterium arcticum TaxID=2585771 RepID=A0A5B8YNX0_9FLAO|nr:hypothetical protein [Antarcticibacterium arcticum]QED38557.1 hypothetical protein FK178_12885 [Antarcticibacterium arcticum]